MWRPLLAKQQAHRRLLMPFQRCSAIVQPCCSETPRQFTTTRCFMCAAVSRQKSISLSFSQEQRMSRARGLPGSPDRRHGHGGRAALSSSSSAPPSSSSPSPSTSMISGLPAVATMQGVVPPPETTADLVDFLEVCEQKAPVTSTAASSAAEVFIGNATNPGWGRLFGGHIMAQSLAAMQKSAGNVLATSFHGYFARPGRVGVYRFGTACNSAMFFCLPTSTTD